MGSTKSTAGSANAARSPRSVTRESRTATLMENIMTGGEVSKKREAELQKAANYGRGVKFVEASPTVKGLTQKGGKPVYRTGVTAQDFTGRITANEPTLKELGGDIVRGLVGGQAPDPGYTGEFSKYTPKPQPVKGLIPTVINAAISGSLSPIGAIMKGVSSSGFFSYGDGKDSKTTATTAPETTTEFAESEAEAERKKKLAGSLVSSATKGRSLFQIKGRTISGGMA
jgi:hypothetical protein